MALLMVPVGFDHGKFQFKLALICAQTLPDLEWTGPVTLNFEDRTNPEPDLIGWRDGSPHVVVEVSQATIKADTGYKLRMYESNGVPFYVVMDINSGILQTYGLNNGVYVDNPEYLAGIKSAFYDRKRSITK